jgi:hypothetical protein
MFLPILFIVAMLASMFVMATPVAAAHGISVVKAQSGPWPNPDIALAGDTVTVEIMVTNMDTTIPSHAVRIDSIVDVVQHASGNVSSGNLLSSPVILPVYLSYITVNYTYVVENGDSNPLIDSASAAGVDLGTGLAVSGSSMYQLTIIAPDIDIEKYVSVDGGTTWLDADTAAGPLAAVGSDVKFKVVVTNTGDAQLTNIVVGDTDFTFTGVATTLAPLASDESNVLTVAAVAGQQYDLADVTGTPSVGPDVTDEDPAYYGTSSEVGVTPLPVNKWAVLAPWAVLAGFLGVLAFLALRKRRQA